MRTCCVTGHRPKGFPWNYRDNACDKHQAYLSSLKGAIIDLIENNGYTHFISGLAIGADLDFASLCIELRDTKYPNITVEGAIPCPNQTEKWTQADKDRYDDIFNRLNKVTDVSPRYTPACYQKRNEYMIDSSDLVIAVWNGKKKGGTFNAIRYAESKQKPISYINLTE